MMNLYRILSVTSQSYRKSQSDGHRSRFITAVHGSLVNNHTMISVHSLEPGSDFGERYAFQPHADCAIATGLKALKRQPRFTCRPGNQGHQLTAAFRLVCVSRATRRCPA